MAEGLAALVENPLAAPLLRVVLPRCEALLYDSSARVRAAMADLLLGMRCGGRACYLGMGGCGSGRCRRRRQAARRVQRRSTCRHTGP